MLDEQRREFARRRFLAMPLAGAVVWTIVGIGGALLPPLAEVWLLFIGTGFILGIGMFFSRFTGEDFLAKNKPKNAFDTLFFLTVAMALTVYSIAIPFFEVDYTSLPLTVGILSGLMWIPLSWMIDHWIGIFHTVVRTVLVVAAWYIFPHNRFVVIPAVIVAVYAVTIIILERRWRGLPRLPTAVKIGLLAAAACEALLPGRAAAAGTQDVVPRFEPAACSTQMPLPEKARCGFLVVPENRTTRDGKTIRIAVAIVPAASKKPMPVPLVYLAGGPGGAPILATSLLVASGFNADHDLVLVEQRGTYYSEPQLTCPVLDRFFTRLLGLVYDAESTRVEHVAATQACRDQFAAKGVDLAAYNTTENAADFADLRRALGYKQWNLYGVSYGTNLALTLMRTDPQGIGSVVLDSTEPPYLVALPPFWPSARDGFDNLFAACAAQRPCGGRYPGLRERFAGLVRDLEAHPVTTSVTDPATKRSVRVTTDGGALANWLVSMSFLAPQYKDVPRWIDELATGDPHSIASSRVGSVTPEGLIGYGLTLGVICSEWVPFTTHAQILTEGQNALPDYPSSALEEPPQFTYVTDDCRVWDVPKAPAAMREPVHSTIRTLILSGSFDAVTSLAWAKAAAATLPNSRLLEFPGNGHDVTTGSKCAQAVMNSFLARPDAPDVGCVASVKPPVFTTDSPR